MLQRYLDLLVRVLPSNVRGRYTADFHAFWQEQFMEKRYAGVVGKGRFFVTVTVDAFLLAFRAVPARQPRHRTSFVNVIGQNVQYTIRMLWRAPLFTLVAVATLALGIGATTTVFSVVWGVLLRPLPYARSDRLVTIQRVSEVQSSASVAWPDYRDWRDAQTRSFEGFAAYTESAVTLQHQGSAESLSGAMVTADVFEVLGAPLQHGRAFTSDEVAFNGPDAIVLAHEFWADRYGSDQDVVGRTLRLDGKDMPVVGIGAPGFYFPNRETQYWMPLHEDRVLQDVGLPTGGRSLAFLSVVARVKDDVGMTMARGEMVDLARRIDESAATYRAGYGVSMHGLLDAMVGDVRNTLFFMLGAVSLVLLVACANIAGLSLGRASERTREIALRVALGASRGRIAGQVLTENLVLALLAGVVGIAASVGLAAILVRLAPAGVPRLDDVRVDLGTIAFGVSATMVTGLLLGLLPASRLTSGNPVVGLRSNDRSATAAAKTLRAQRGLVVLQVALAVVLMTGAALLVKSYASLSGEEKGFSSNGVVIASVSPTLGEDVQPEQLSIFYDELLDRVRALPGVVAASSTYSPPFTGNGFRMTLRGEHDPTDTEDRRWVETIIVRGEYFRTMGIPFHAGRDFETGDRIGNMPVAIVNETMAEQFWPGEDPIGKRLISTGGIAGSADSFDRAFFPDEPYTVIGVVGDTRNEQLSELPTATWYRPHRQITWAYQYLVVAVSAQEQGFASTLRELIWSLDPTVPVQTVRTLDSQLLDTVAVPRFRTLLFGAFAAVACALATIGIYSVIALSVIRRRREIGIRMALGADTGRVVRDTLVSGGKLIAVGTVVGVVIAFVAARYLSAMLYRVSPTDPLTYVLVVLGVVSVALAACVIPATRAGLLDPAQSLRVE